MSITTKELFELAEIFSDGYDDSGFDPEFVPWHEFEPGEQAAFAEGIRAVIEEYERRHGVKDAGYVPESSIPNAFFIRSWSIPDDAPLDVSNWSIPAPDTETRAKRFWDRIEDVPPDVRVTDCSGDVIALDVDGRWKVQHEFPWYDEDQNDYAPFTEILEYHESRWDRWEEVPEGVVVASNDDDWYYRKIDGRVCLSGGSISAWNGDSGFNEAKAPFTRVVD